MINTKQDTITSVLGKVGRQYPACKPGEICRPVEGHFCTECETLGCNKFN